MSEAIPYESSGRTNQKARTRAALVEAARGLLADGATPTVEEAAASAAIARATAYRYFPDQRSLLIATFPELTEPSLLGDSPPGGARLRLEIVIDGISRMAVEHEPALRNMLRLSLEPNGGRDRDLAFRKGRRIVWVTEALEPIREQLPSDEFERLVIAIAASVGIDSLVWLSDIAGLSPEQAVDIMRWSALALFDAAVNETRS
ncbi:TetR/AcrR family transcriptional regulator [soil metagenome]